jgi:prepilin-type N-terminal cleavage/methylation domain-containing protein
MSRTGVHRGRRGFTLIEVLVAVVILATGIVAILRVFQTSTVALAEARDMLGGMSEVRRIMADLQQAADRGGSASLTARSGRWEDSGGYGSDVRVSVVQREPDAGVPEGRKAAVLHSVSVSVWRSGGSGRRYSSATYLRTDH